MAAMLESYAGGLQQSFASVFERVGQSLSQSAQVMQMMNDVMEAALLQNLVLSSSLDPNGGDPQLLVSVENRSQIHLAQVTVSVRLNSTGSNLLSTTLEPLGVGERHELRASLKDAVAPVSGTIELAFESPGTHQPLSKSTAFHVLFFQQGVFEAVQKTESEAMSEVSAVSEKVALERVREVLQLSPLDGVLTDDVGRYRFVQNGQQERGVDYYLAVRRSTTPTAFLVVVSAAGNGSTQGRQARCEQIIHELEGLSEDVVTAEQEQNGEDMEQ